MNFNYDVEIGGVDGLRIYDRMSGDLGPQITFYDATCMVVDQIKDVDINVIGLADDYVNGNDMSIYDDIYTTKIDLLIDLQKGIKYNELEDRVEMLKKNCDVNYILCIECSSIIEIHITQYLLYGHALSDKSIIIPLRKQSKEITQCMQNKLFNVTKYFEEVLKLQKVDKNIKNDEGNFFIDIDLQNAL